MPQRVLHDVIYSVFKRHAAPVLWLGANLMGEPHNCKLRASGIFAPYEVFHFVLVEPLLIPALLPRLPTLGTA
jgi:hypothetical protein